MGEVLGNMGVRSVVYPLQSREVLREGCVSFLVHVCVGGLVRRVVVGGGIGGRGGVGDTDELEAEEAGDAAEARKGDVEGCDLRAGMLFVGEARGWIGIRVVKHGPIAGNNAHESKPVLKFVCARNLVEQVMWCVRRNVEIMCKGPVLSIALILRFRLDEQGNRAADEGRARGVVLHAGGGGVLYTGGLGRLARLERVGRAGTGA